MYLRTCVRLRLPRAAIKLQSADRFCSDCKHNVVQAHDILMGKIDLEGCENEEEFDEVLKLYKERGVFDSGGDGRV